MWDHWYDTRFFEAPPSGTVEYSFRSIFEAFASKTPNYRPNQNFKQKNIRSGKSLCGRLCVLLRSVLVVRRGDEH